MKKKTEYIGTQIFSTKNHCLSTRADPGVVDWIGVCDENDPECTGTSDCKKFCVCVFHSYFAPIWANGILFAWSLISNRDSANLIDTVPFSPELTCIQIFWDSKKQVRIHAFFYKKR